MSPTTAQPVTSLQQVLEVSKKIQAGEDVPLEILQACFTYLRQNRAAGAAQAKAKAEAKPAKQPKQPLDPAAMQALMEEI